MINQILTGLPWDLMRNARNPAQARQVVRYLRNVENITQVPKPVDCDEILPKIALPVILFYLRNRLVWIDNPLEDLSPEQRVALKKQLPVDPSKIRYILHFAHSLSSMERYIQFLHATFDMNVYMPALDADISEIFKVLCSSAYNETDELTKLRGACLLMVKFPFADLRIRQHYEDDAFLFFERRRSRGYTTVFVEHVPSVKSEKDISSFLSSQVSTSRFVRMLLDPRTAVTHDF